MTDTPVTRRPARGREAITPDDAELALLGLAHAPGEAAECCRVACEAGGGQPVASVVVEYVRYAPGRECVVQFALGPIVGDHGRRAVLTVRRDGGLREVHRRHYGAAGRTAATRQAVYRPEVGHLVEFFPADWELPSLSWALDASAVGAALPDLLDPRSLVKVLRYRPHSRAVLAYLAPAAGPQARDAVGKLYRSRRTALRAQNGFRLVHRHAVSRDLVVPEPLGYVDDHRLVLMEYLAGLPLEAVLLDAPDTVAAREATRLAARTLVRLHDLPADGLRPARAEPDHVRRLAGRLALIAPRLADAVLELLDSIPGDDGARGFVHGAYAARQLLLRGDRAAVVDLDTAGAGDPAADLGNFMAGLHARAMLGARPMLRDIADDFLAAYLAEAPADGLAARARSAQAVALARTALNSHCKPRQWTSLSAADVPTLLLAEATACLRAA